MRPTTRSLIRLVLAVLPLVSVAAGQIEMPTGPTTNANPGENSNWLSLDELGMPRSSIRFGDAPIRLFNGWGAVSVRDKSVTGLQKLLFPPVDLPDYNFSLSFREAKTGVLIQDTVPDYFKRVLETGQGMTPLGLNFLPGTPYVLLWQRAYWQPNAMFRTGTFHKELNGHWISFGLTTKASVSAKADANLQNRRNALGSRRCGFWRRRPICRRALTSFRLSLSPGQV